jgi:hypothetical protein
MLLLLPLQNNAEGKVVPGKGKAIPVTGSEGA